MTHEPWERNPFPSWSPVSFSILLSSCPSLLLPSPPSFHLLWHPPQERRESRCKNLEGREEGRAEGERGRARLRGVAAVCWGLAKPRVCVCVWDQYWAAREIDQAYTASSQPPSPTPFYPYPYPTHPPLSSPCPHLPLPALPPPVP